MTRTNFFIVHMTNLDTDEPYKYIGLYSSKEKADEAGKKACELFDEDRMHFTVTLDILDR